MKVAEMFYILSFLLSALGAWVIKSSAGKLGLLDFPNDRSSHTEPTPKGGGAGILLAHVFSALWWHFPMVNWVPAAVVSAVSLWGDFRELPVKFRLAVQTTAAAIISGFVFLMQPAHQLGVVLSGLFFLLGALYIAATANCFNFMDGINGIAGLSGFVAFSLLGAFGFLESKDSVAPSVAFGIAAACLGFLPFNFPRAKVFMGDVGSVLLGFLFASWIIVNSKSLIEFAVLASFLFPFYVDELNTQWTRIKARESLSTPHRRHIYQILVNRGGFSHGVITAIYGAVQILVSVATWIMMRVGSCAVICLLVVISGFSLWGASSIRHRWEAAKEIPE